MRLKIRSICGISVSLYSIKRMNSSPPTLAAMSVLLMFSFILSATAIKISSPKRCPYSSLAFLKLSKSSTARAYFFPFASASAINSSILRFAAVWFKSPVFWSRSAFFSSSSIISVSSFTSTIFPITPSGSDCSPSLHNARAITLLHFCCPPRFNKNLFIATGLEGLVLRISSRNLLKSSAGKISAHSRLFDGSEILTGKPSNSALHSESCNASGTKEYSKIISPEMSDKKRNFCRSISKSLIERSLAVPFSPCSICFTVS